MSSATAEYILRDIFFRKVSVSSKSLSDDTQKYLTFIPAKAICEFLVSENAIPKNLLESFKLLGELWGRYSNVIPKKSEDDSQRALYHLHKILINLSKN